MPQHGAGSRLIIESRPFPKEPPPDARPGLFEGDPDWFRRQAESWADFIRVQHPKDDVFVIER